MSNSVEFQNRIKDFAIFNENEKVKTCKAIGVDSRSLTLAMEYGILPSSTTLIKIADYYMISIDYLLGLTDDETYSPSKIKTSFNERLKTLLEENNITAYKLAKDCHFDNSYITKWTQGKHVASIEFLELLSDYFKVSIDYLLGRTDYKN